MAGAVPASRAARCGDEGRPDGGGDGDRAMRPGGAARPTARHAFGGERQRAWIALALAQEPELLLLDEPTTFLDIGHQQELLQLLCALNASRGLTIVMVMHDIAQAAHCAHRLVAMQGGRLIVDGTPAEVVTAERIGVLFGASVTVLRHPESGAPIVVPATFLRGD